MASVKPVTAPPSRPHQVGLLQLADRLVGVQADLGDPALQAWFDTVVDALGHAFVDLADGATGPVVPAPAPRPGSTVGPRTRGDAASCSAAAAQIHTLLRALREVDVPAAAAPFADQVCHAVGAVVHGLQRYAQDLRGAGPDGSAPADRQRLLRVLRAALSVGSPSEAPAPGTTVGP